MKDNLQNSLNNLLNLISLEALKCKRENGKILLFSFTIMNNNFNKEKLIQMLNNSFRLYDIIMEYPEDVFNIFIISYKPSPTNFQTFLNRIYFILDSLNMKKSDVLYTFKIYPYEGTNIKKLIELNTKELMKSASLKSSPLLS
ncbi:hypothetical protein [Thermovibrio sp.]